jgi:hypothetical protein
MVTGEEPSDKMRQVTVWWLWADMAQVVQNNEGSNEGVVEKMIVEDDWVEEPV